MKLKTATGKQYSIGWIGVASIDGALRFSLLNIELSEAFAVFTDAAETASMTSSIDLVQNQYDGFTVFKSIDMHPDGSIIVALGKE